MANKIDDNGKTFGKKENLVDQKLKGVGKNINDKIRDAIDGANDKIKDTVDGASDKIKDTVDGANDKLNKIAKGVDKKLDDIAKGVDKKLDDIAKGIDKKLKNIEKDILTAVDSGKKITKKAADKLTDYLADHVLGTDIILRDENYGDVSVTELQHYKNDIIVTNVDKTSKTISYTINAPIEINLPSSKSSIIMNTSVTEDNGKFEWQHEVTIKNNKTGEVITAGITVNSKGISEFTEVGVEDKNGHELKVRKDDYETLNKAAAVCTIAAGAVIVAVAVGDDLVGGFGDDGLIVGAVAAINKAIPVLTK